MPESRIVADLLLRGVDDNEWRDAIDVQNALQKRSPATARRQASLIKARLTCMDSDLWELVRDGSHTVATHALFAAAVKHSCLLGDFVDLIVREQFRLFRTELPRKLWSDYLALCRSRDPNLPEWKESTSNKLADSVYRILAEVGILKDSKSYKLQPVSIAPEVIAYLNRHNEQYVRRCLEASA